MELREWINRWGRSGVDIKEYSLHGEYKLLLPNMNHKVGLNLAVYSERFTNRLWIDLISLRTVLSGIESGHYNDNVSRTTNGMSFTTKQVTLDQGLIDYEVMKTFISVMRNTNDYLDRLVSIINFWQKPLHIPRKMSAVEAGKYVDSQLDLAMHEYNDKKREDFAMKLKHFPELPSEDVRFLTNYNLLRNCYEHHKAISQRGLQIPINKLVLEANGKTINIPSVVEAGMKIAISRKTKTVAIKKGEAAKLSYGDFEFAVFYLTQLPIKIEPTVIEALRQTAAQISEVK